MSDKEFGEREFALGSIIGQRAWRVNADGVLYGVSHAQNWLPGENVAQCDTYPPDKVVPRKAENESYELYNKRVQAWKSDHEMIGCSHGFYAYTDSDNDYYYSHDPVLVGVVEGYGETLIGTNGFRCMKARILAVSVTPFKGVWALEPFVIERLRRNYPGVAFFESRLAMWSEFPVTEAAIAEEVA